MHVLEKEDTCQRTVMSKLAKTAFCGGNEKKSKSSECKIAVCAQNGAIKVLSNDCAEQDSSAHEVKTIDGREDMCAFFLGSVSSASARL